jgi:hypothetical protein
MIQGKSTTKNRTLARGISKGKTTAQNISKITRPRERGRFEITPTVEGTENARPSARMRRKT